MDMRFRRFDSIDILRGVAMVWMTVFHFSFDLAHAGYTQQNFYTDPVWTVQRTCILSLFLWCAGASQAIALHQQQSWSKFWRRWSQIAGCALLVSVGSWAMFPTSYIYFGVLHGMAVMLLIARLSAPAGGWLWPLGAMALLLPSAASFLIGGGWVSPAFNARALNWLGFISIKPITEDYVPLLPWLGVMWWGMAATRWWLGRAPTEAAHISIAWLTRTTLGSLLARLGQWSLRYYMLHQPVLLALLWCWAAVYPSLGH